ncbi:hypothetical protein NP493_395g02000 [Ridgeia piscesae]|uniref:Uncharacterized protein n=1 Tax=Ridgeia piscesae TaxID=27915 RepID=A0AAD9L1V7_RIDPI|nr:hypothetical protein NP493_395g02000 [Ridgeia piscesae]
MAGGEGSPLAYRKSNLSIQMYPALLRYMSIFIFKHINTTSTADCVGASIVNCLKIKSTYT